MFDFLPNIVFLHTFFTVVFADKFAFILLFSCVGVLLSHATDDFRGFQNITWPTPDGYF